MIPRGKKKECMRHDRDVAMTANQPYGKVPHPTHNSINCEHDLRVDLIEGQQIVKNYFIFLEERG